MKNMSTDNEIQGDVQASAVTLGLTYDIFLIVEVSLQPRCVDSFVVVDWMVQIFLRLWT